jgi:hypothetical protein
LKPKVKVRPREYWPDFAPGHVFLVLTGTPRTKKNHPILAHGRTKVLPSREWQRWAKVAEVRIPLSRTRILHMVAPPAGWGYLYDTREMIWIGATEIAMLPELEYNCAALIYRHKRVGDAVGYYQAIADLLELKRVVSNDRQITQWDGTRMLLDPGNPRVELVLTPNAPAEGPER